MQLPRSVRLPALLLALVVAACDQPPEDSPAHEVQQRLVGTWLREYDEQGAHVRRILVLDANGEFQERSDIVDAGTGQHVEARGSGRWLFDGTNLKRHYASVNGKALSAPTMPFVTFQISFPSKSEFVGVDNVHHVEVRYARAPEGSEP